MNIFEKLSNITSELSAVAKNLSVGEGRNSYKAVGEADVLAAVKPLEKKYGVYSYPVSRKISDSAILNTTKTYKNEVTETTKQFMRVETVYRFVNIEKPDEYLDMTTYGDGVDANDKAPGKAMTYADKYALLKAYKIITGDDPDQQYSYEEKQTIVDQTNGDKTQGDDRQQSTNKGTVSPQDVSLLYAELKRTGIGLKGLLENYGIKAIEQMKLSEFADAMKVLKSKPTKEA